MYIYLMKMNVVVFFKWEWNTSFNVNGIMKEQSFNFV